MDTCAAWQAPEASCTLRTSLLADANHYLSSMCSRRGTRAGMSCNLYTLDHFVQGVTLEQPATSRAQRASARNGMHTHTCNRFAKYTPKKPLGINLARI